MSTGIPLVDSLPRGDPFAQQYRRGFRRLSFSAPLEADYRKWGWEHHRETGTICAVIGLVIWLIFLIFDVSRLVIAGALEDAGGRSLDIIILRLIAVMAILAYLLAQRLRLPFIDRCTFAFYIVLGVASAQIVIVYIDFGFPRWDATQMVIVMATFLPIGMSFQQALGAALIIVATTWGLGALQLDASEIQGNERFVMSLLCAVAVGALGSYLREYSEREQFLLRGMLTRLATVDSLSNLPNRREFEGRAGAALAQASRTGEDVVLAVIDIDYFKRYNDRYGHAAGDQVIREIAGALNSATRRPLDMAARVGGEEFYVLLYGTDQTRALPIFEGLHRTIAGLGISHAESDISDRVTISIGVATYDGAEGLESLTRRADEMLYVAKAEGRGITRFANPLGRA